MKSWKILDKDGRPTRIMMNDRVFFYQGKDYVKIKFSRPNWRDGLEPLMLYVDENGLAKSEFRIPDVKIDDISGNILSMISGSQFRRMALAIKSQGGQMWFLK